MSLAFDGPAVFQAIRADHQLVEQLRRDRTSPPDCDPPSQRLVALLSAWQREIDADPFPTILLDEAMAAARRGAQSPSLANKNNIGGATPNPNAACSSLSGPVEPPQSASASHLLPPTDSATGPATPSRPGSTPQEVPVLDSETGPIERVTVDFRKTRPQLPDTSAYREWINSPLTDDEPARFNVLQVAAAIALAEIVVVALVLLWALT
jgi:hypothetical protein